MELKLLLASVILTFIISTYSFISGPKGTFRKFFRITPSMADKRLWLVSISILAVSKIIFFSLSFLEEGSTTSDPNSLDKLMGRGPGWIIAIVLVGTIVVPIIEEIVFRGYLLGPFIKENPKFALPFGLILTSALFALSHGAPVLDKFFSGLVYANLRVKQKSLIGSILLHAIFNFLLLAALGLFIASGSN